MVRETKLVDITDRFIVLENIACTYRNNKIVEDYPILYVERDPVENHEPHKINVRVDPKTIAILEAEKEYFTIAQVQELLKKFPDSRLPSAGLTFHILHSLLPHTDRREISDFLSQYKDLPGGFWQDTALLWGSNKYTHTFHKKLETDPYVPPEVIANYSLREHGPHGTRAEDSSAILFPNRIDVFSFTRYNTMSSLVYLFEENGCTFLKDLTGSPDSTIFRSLGEYFRNGMYIVHEYYKPKSGQSWVTIGKLEDKFFGMHVNRGMVSLGCHRDRFSRVNKDLAAVRLVYTSN